jgi:hypothetical protein
MPLPRALSNRSSATGSGRRSCQTRNETRQDVFRLHRDVPQSEGADTGNGMPLPDFQQMRNKAIERNAVSCGSRLRKAIEPHKSL